MSQGNGAIDEATTSWPVRITITSLLTRTTKEIHELKGRPRAIDINGVPSGGTVDVEG